MPGSFQVNQHNINALLRSPGGPGGRDLAARLRRVEARAKVLCPVRRAPGGGRLRSSIRSTPVRRTSFGLEGSVGTNVVYAAAVHEGRGSRYAPPSWAARGPGPRRFLANALAAAR